MEDIVAVLARQIGALTAEVARLRHRQDNLFRPGTVKGVKPGEYRARVKLSDKDGQDFLSPWRPWAAVAGARAQDWAPLEEGQQVLVLSPTGVLGQSLILPFGFSDDHPPPSTSADERIFGFGGSRFRLTDGEIEHISEKHKLTGEVVTDGKTYLGSPDAVKRVLLEDGSPATKVFGV